MPDRDHSDDLVTFSSRVFLRAINKFAEIMNQKFLEHTNFEFQVSRGPPGWLRAPGRVALGSHTGCSIGHVPVHSWVCPCLWGSHRGVGRVGSVRVWNWAVDAVVIR